MERLNLREAAEMTSLSVTTLRRYIRSGRLRAEKEDGRYGPEYFVTPQDLEEAGVRSGADVMVERAPAPIGGTTTTSESEAGRALARPVHNTTVPADLYRELQWKHEQLLVQYGMMRAGGLRAVELREQLAEREREIETHQKEARELRTRHSEELERLQRQLRQARFELEGRDVEVAALRQKVRALELLTRNRVTTESIDEQYDKLVRQAHRVGRRTRGRQTPETPSPPRRRAWIVRDVPPPEDH